MQRIQRTMEVYLKAQGTTTGKELSCLNIHSSLVVK